MKKAAIFVLAMLMMAACALADTPIVLTMNGTPIRAAINDTVTGRAFLDMLPWSTTVSRAPDDLCGSVSEELPAEDSEQQFGWRIGEIGWFDGWFTILVDNEEAFADGYRMIIGKVEAADIPAVQTMTGRIEITAELAQTAEQITLEANGKSLTFTAADNEAGRALVEKLREGPVTVATHSYGDFEQVGALGFELPANDTQITTQPGDIMLYAGDQLTIYYDSNTWSYTPLGHVEGATRESMLDVLGQEDTQVTLRLAE